MITASKVSDVSYYTGGGGVAAGMESYYTGTATSGEPPGQWSGALAERLGLAGEVEPNVMETVYGRFETPEGEAIGSRPGQYGSPASVDRRLAEWVDSHPDALPEEVDEQRRRIEADTRKATLGVDLTTSVTKSVSVIHTALKREEVEAEESGDTRRLEEARAGRLLLDRAIAKANDAAKVYAATLTVSRTGRHGGAGTAGRWIKAPGTIWSSFYQHYSRAIQPQLHTHNVLHRQVECVDGKIRAVDTVDLFAQQHAVSAVFDRVLVEQLAAAGLPMRMTKGEHRERPAWEVAFVPQEVSEFFSARARQIRGELKRMVGVAEKELGRELTDVEVQRLHKRVTKNTRAKKTGQGETDKAMIRRWQSELQEAVGSALGPIGGRVLSALAAGRSEPPVGEFSPSAVLSAAVAAVSEERATWRRSDLILEIENRLPILGTSEDIPELLERLADAALSDPSLVTQTSGREDVAIPAELGGSDVYTRPTAKRYAATGSLAAEESIRRAGMVRDRHWVAAEDVDAHLDAHHQTVGVDQRYAIRSILSSDAELVELEGPAGTGKSYTVGVMADTWGELSGGGRVQGLAVSQIATDVLSQDGVEVTANLSVWLDAQRRLVARKPNAGDEAFRISSRDIVLIDEASMAATADLERVLRHVRAAGARLVLAGDGRQLASVQAGGVMGLVDGHAEKYTLTEVRRFRSKWEGPASLRLREGDAAVLADYDRRGRIVDADNIDDAITKAARAAAADRIDGRTVVVTAATNDDAAKVAAAVRDILIDAGVVRPVEGEVDLTEHGGSASPGDLVMCRKNNRRIGVTNRQLYEVRDVGEDGSLTVANSKSGEVLRLPARYVSDHVASGYGGTVHATQGVTVDAGYGVTAGNIDAAGLYVMATRGRLMNRLFVSTSVSDDDPSKAQASRVLESGKTAVAVAVADQERPSGRAVLESAMAKDAEDGLAALVAMERDDDRQASASTILGRIEDGVRIACRVRLDRHLDELAAFGVIDEDARGRLAAEQETEHLAKLLRAQEQAGNDPAALLRHAAMDPRGFTVKDRKTGEQVPVESVARVLSSRISSTVAKSAGSATPPPSTAKIPAGVSPNVYLYLENRHQRLEERRAHLGAQTAQEAPEWAVRALGPVPEDALALLEWQSKAGVLAGYREATGWADERRAIDNAPGIHATERRQMWDEAWTVLGKPADTREEAAMTTGQLRVRVAAWDREKSWLPAHADQALKVAVVEADEARQTAVLAGSDQQAERMEQISSQRAADAEALEFVAESRDESIAHTSVTHANAVRALEELRNRDEEVGQEQDRTTAAVWLAEQRAADRAEEARRRSLAEVEVVDPVKDDALADGVADRAGEVAQVPTPRDEAWETLLDVPEEDLVDYVEEVPEQAPSSAHERIPVRVSSVELAAKTATAAEAFDRIADRESQELEASKTVYDDAFDEAHRVERREAAHVVELSPAE